MFAISKEVESHAKWLATLAGRRDLPWQPIVKPSLTERGGSWFPDPQAMKWQDVCGAKVLARDQPEGGVMKSWSCTSCAFMPISLRPFPPLAKGGQGGWFRHDRSQDLPMLFLSQSFRIPLARREESFSLSKAPASPPLPPLRKGGKGIARSRRHSIARNKTMRLETVSPARSTPTFHHPSRTDSCVLELQRVGP